MSIHPPIAEESRRPDRELLSAVAGRDRRAFEILYRRYRRPLFGYLRPRLHRLDRVEEVFDDVMMVVWRRAVSFDGRSRVSTWIFGIAFRKAMKALERHARYERTLAEEEFDEPLEPEMTDSRLRRGELVRSLREALAELSVEQRTVVELTYGRGLSYRDIAARTGVPVNTVKTRMFHARRRLRELLPAEEFIGAAAQRGVDP